MTYDEYRKKCGYKRLYNTRGGGARLSREINDTRYADLDEYEVEAYRRLAYARKVAEKNGVIIQKISKQNYYLATLPGSLVKVFNSVDDLNDFIYKFDLVNKYFLEER